mmetsp:Transcript_100977/g.290447  ORF Transcript_100977/g.290447 Transcript_100977/m.290447 type:complete len:319 (+) Transcript_100977:412-1368(+)
MLQRLLPLEAGALRPRAACTVKGRLGRMRIAARRAGVAVRHAAEAGLARLPLHDGLKLVALRLARTRHLVPAVVQVAEVAVGAVGATDDGMREHAWSALANAMELRPDGRHIVALRHLAEVAAIIRRGALAADGNIAGGRLVVEDDVQPVALAVALGIVACHRAVPAAARHSGGVLRHHVAGRVAGAGVRDHTAANATGQRCAQVGVRVRGPRGDAGCPADRLVGRKALVGVVGLRDACLAGAVLLRRSPPQDVHLLRRHVTLPLVALEFLVLQKMRGQLPVIFAHGRRRAGALSRAPTVRGARLGPVRLRPKLRARP